MIAHRMWLCSTHTLTADIIARKSFYRLLLEAVFLIAARKEHKKAARLLEAPKISVNHCLAEIGKLLVGRAAITTNVSELAEGGYCEHKSSIELLLLIFFICRIRIDGQEHFIVILNLFIRFRLNYFCKMDGTQKMTTLFIKNMVCNRCIMVVQNELDKLDLSAISIKLGEIVFGKELTPEQKKKLGEALSALGFQVIDDKKSRIIEKIKNTIIELVHHQDNEAKTNLSDILSATLHHDYNYLSNLFSEVEGTTIEKYFIAQKIERVKELLVYDELSLSEIAFQLNYSSVAYLSNQFKKTTGLTPRHFKQIKEEKRKPLDKV